MKKYYLVGIGGIGMRALAELLSDMGHEVLGSDMEDFEEKDELREKGIQVFIGHSEDQLPEDTDMLVYSSAIPKTNPERGEAKRRNIPQLRRAEMIGELMQDRDGIAVSGTHGKTTTSSLLYDVLDSGGLGPSALIGAEVKSIEGASRLGKGDLMVVEACEYDRSFLDMEPKSAIITNIEKDHLDYYQDGLEEIVSAFKRFSNGLEDYLVAFGDDPEVRAAVSDTSAELILYGEGKKNDWRLLNHFLNGDGVSHWKVESPDGEEKELSVGLPGREMALDALAATIMGMSFGVSWQVANDVVTEFQGSKRRFEKKYVSDELVLIDDYAHHPTEILSLLEAAEELYANREVYAVFQPHQISRTRILFDDFIEVLQTADNLAILPVYSARDKGEAATPEELSQKLAEESDSQYVEDFSQAIDWLEEGETPAVWLTVGAGRTNELADEILTSLED